MQKSKRAPALTVITRGTEPLMGEVRAALRSMEGKYRRIDIVTHFTGDVSYDENAVAVFIYEEQTMRKPEYLGKFSRPSKYLMVGSSSTLFARLQMEPITWAPKARVCIALWPIKPDHLNEGTRREFALAVCEAVRQARSKLNVMNNPKGISRRKKRAQEHAQQSATA